MINKECKDRDALALVTYIAEEDKLDKILGKSADFKNSDRSQWQTGDTGISAGCVEDVGIKELPMNQDTLSISRKRILGRMLFVEFREKHRFMCRPEK